MVTCCAHLTLPHYDQYKCVCVCVCACACVRACARIHVYDCERHHRKMAGFNGVIVVVYPYRHVSCTCVNVVSCFMSFNCNRD